MATRARNLANLLGGGEVTVPASKLSDEISTIEQASSTDVLTNLGNTVGDQRLVGNNLYIWNGSGWYRIALINQTPTWDSGGQPSISYALDRDSPQDATVITLAASDPDGLPISYSYVTGGSMDSMATIGQDSSVFTITPKTINEVGEGVELTGSITFRASDGVNILPHVSSFSLSFIFFVENSRYTILLASTTNTSVNKNITDSSTNNHTITVNGNATAGSYSPYPDSKYSANMNGGDLYYLSSSADWNLGSNWTIEGWFYPTAQPTETCRLFMFGTNGGSAAMGIGLNSDMTWGGGGAFANGAMFNLPQGYLNQWQHVAWVRDGNSNTGTIYVNGVASAGSYSGPAVQAAGNVDLKIGYDTVGTVAYQYQGYIADLRITKSAVYTSNFTPATERLTSSDVLTDTKLLTFNRAYLKDESASEHGIAINAGNPRLTAFSPFDKLKYSVTDNGGSVNFNGSSDWLTAPASLLAYDANATFTIEGWVYHEARTTASQNYHSQALFGKGDTYFNFGIIGTGHLLFYHYDGTARTLNSASPILPGTWTHVAAVVSGGTVTLYINGKSAPGATGTWYGIQAAGHSQNVTIGRPSTNAAANYFNGSFSDLRISDSAVYTSDFTPPTTPLSSTGSVFHLKGTDASIVDISNNNSLRLFYNTTGSTTQTKFANTKSIYFDGTDDYLQTPTSFSNSLGTSDFTIELWLNGANTQGQDASLVADYAPSWAANSSSLHYRHSNPSVGSGKIAYWMYNHSSSAAMLVSTTTTSADTWYHLAVTREGSTFRMFVDGVLEASATSSVSIDSNREKFYIIGSVLAGTANSTMFNGYMQDIRITKGLARYTANFTPPTKPLEG